MSSARVKFGDIVRKVNDKVDPSVDDIERFVAGEHMDTDEQKIFRFGNVGEGYLGPAFHMRFKPGHILYGSRRTYLRKVAMADFEGVCSNTTFVITPSDDRLNASYLLNVMSTERFHQNSISLSKGSINPYINFSDLAAYEFELPSIEEQQRIVELLSGVDAHAEALRNQLHVAKETRKSVLHHLLNAGGDDWTETTLGKVTKVIMGRQLSPSKRVGTRPRPYLRAANIGVWGININDILEMDFTEDEEANFASKPGDVLLVEGGNEKSVGCPALVTDREAGLCIQNTIIRCRVNDIWELLPAFLYHRLRFSFWRGDFGEMCTGTTIMHLGQRRAVLFPFLLPPLAEQQRIVDEILKIDSVIDETTSALAATRQLRSALLNKEIS